MLGDRHGARSFLSQNVCVSGSTNYPYTVRSPSRRHGSIHPLSCGGLAPRQSCPTALFQGCKSLPCHISIFFTRFLDEVQVVFTLLACNAGVLVEAITQGA